MMWLILALLVSVHLLWRHPEPLGYWLGYVVASLKRVK